MGSKTAPRGDSSDLRPDDQDYFLDMIEQLAERARAIGEVEVATHLTATARARRHALRKADAQDM